MDSLRSGLRRFIVACVTVGLLAGSWLCADESDPEEIKEKSVTDRFVVVLEKNPRRGTALDKVYGYHVERGSLATLINGYREKGKSSQGAQAGSAWLIVGLLESLRGQDAVAVESFEQAEKLSSDNYLASYYLGQSLILVGQPDKAADALERAIERKPVQADLLDVYQALGRVYQRAQKSDKALGVWNRLEKQFPNDVRVQEQIATTLLEENEFAAALPRYEALAKNTKDKYRQSLFQMEVADIKVRLGKPDQAAQDYESLLAQLLPENWLYREVRRRIEAIYLRTDDQTGLIAYYEAWLKKSPKDLDAIQRLSRLLAGLGRNSEAESWLESGLKIAPSKKELRRALILQYDYERKFHEAVAQFEQLDKYEPNNPDTLREWGRMVLKDTTQDGSTRKQAAAAIWRRLMDARPNDPFVVSQVGELFRRADLTDESLELYQKAIALAPDQPQYREYLGEYYHALKRKDEALEAWRAIADGPQRTAPNLARLAEVLASFGYLSEAVEINVQACQLDPKNFALQLKHADVLSEADRHKEAIEQLAALKKLSASDEEREAVLGRELRELQSIGALKDRISELANDVDSTDADHWFWLARAYEKERLLNDAADSVAKAATLAANSIPILMASARINEAQNNSTTAVDAYTKLAAIDRRFRTEYLKQVATLEQKLGRRARAIQAGRDLIAAAPGNPDLYEFFSRLCFQLGEPEEGLAALRRSVRVNPTEPKGLLLLAAALKEQFRTNEAIELYWRAFDKAANLDDRLAIVPLLTELYLQLNQFDRLLERLERQRREATQQRETTICLAQAYQSAGDDGSARQELEKLLSEDTRDTQLLNQLVNLCESDGDLEAAVKFQQQVLKSTSGKEGMIRLAQLLMKSGETEEANAIMSRITVEEKDPESVLRSLDSLLAHGNNGQALNILETLRREQPKNWEYLYREGVALAASKETLAEAKLRFEAILTMKLDDDELSASAKSSFKKTQAANRLLLAAAREANPLMNRESLNWEIRQAAKLDDDVDHSNRQQQQPFWSPYDYGCARMASIAWLNQIAVSDGIEEQFVDERRQAAENAEDLRDLIDGFYFSTLTDNGKAAYTVLKRLSMRSDANAEIKSMYLQSLAQREYDPEDENAPEMESPSGGPADDDEPQIPKLSPLEPEEMEHVLACFQSISGDLSLMNYGQSFLQEVVLELKRCERTDDAQALLKTAVDNATEPDQIAMLLSDVVQLHDYSNTMTLLNRLAARPTNVAPNSWMTSTGAFNYAQYVLSPEYQSEILTGLIAWRAKKKAMGDVLELWDRYLTIAVARHQKLREEQARMNRRPQRQPWQQSGSVSVWHGQNRNQDDIDFPTPNAYYDLSTIQMLRQTFVAFQDADTSQDLLEHFRQKLNDAGTPAASKIFWELGLGYLHWWLEQEDEAIKILTAATNSLADHEMTFAMAQLYERRGEHDRALQIVDSLPAGDQRDMQNRETTALRMAVYSGNIERARVAAERLFGLRLDSSLQIQLAEQMHQLGMHELAEAVLARAGRQAGDKTDVLMTLMQQYQSQGMNEIAIQIAHQLLRRTKRNSAGMYSVHGRTVYRDDDGVRHSALIVLQRSGKLEELISKVESQLAKAPASQRLIDTLIEYYTASGNDDKVTALKAKISESKQDDPKHRFQLGLELIQQGKHKEAIEHVLFAIKKDPRLLHNELWMVANLFENQGQAEHLGKILDELDFKLFRQRSWELMNVISSMANEEKTRDHAIQLFKRAWKDLPDDRQQFLQHLDNDVFGQMPDIYEYVRETMIPHGSALRRNAGWMGFGQIQQFGSDGKLVTMMNRFLTMAAANRKLEELRSDVVDVQQRARKWDGAPALLALIDLRRGKYDDAKVVLEKLLPTFKGPQQGEKQYALWEIGQELMDHPECTDLAIRYLEAASRDPNTPTHNFESSPGKMLATLYQRQGRKDEMRRVMLEASRQKPRLLNSNDGEWDANRRLQTTITMGRELLDADFVVDAILLYHEQLARPEDFSAHIHGLHQADRTRKEIENGLQNAVKRMKPEQLSELLAGPAFDRPGQPASALEPANNQHAAIVVLPLVKSSDLKTMYISNAGDSLLAAIAVRPEMLETTRSFLADTRSKRPDDFAPLIVTAQLASQTGEVSKVGDAARELVELMERIPLDPQPAKGGFTARQREAAMSQAALWLVARDCVKHDSLKAAGIKLGERALEAAKRQSDNEFALAILREWGQLAVDAGDTATAERRWSEMLELVLSKPSNGAKRNGDTPIF